MRGIIAAAPAEALSNLGGIRLEHD